jgi:hypothetical protein
MEVSYENTVTDLVRFNRYHQLRHPYLYIMAVLPTLILVKDTWRLARGQPGAWLVTLVVLQLAIFVLVYVVTIAGLYLFLGLRRDRPAHRQHRITLTKTSVIEESPVNRTESAWAGVVKVAQTRRVILIYIARNLAHVVPKRAFATPLEAESFFNEAMARWSAP